jgi:ornithine decarboxylase
MAADLLTAAGRLGLRPLGCRFTSVRRQTDPQAWSSAIAHSAWVFLACAHRGIDLELVNLGGGLPAHYRAPVPPSRTTLQRSRVR